MYLHHMDMTVYFCNGVELSFIGDVLMIGNEVKRNGQNSRS